MKTILIFAFLLLTSFGNPIKKDTCACKNVKLYGDAKITTHQSGADFRVCVVGNFADLNVQTVETTPTRCGEWRFVDTPSADFTVAFVDTESEADFTIHFVTNFPGVN